MKYRLVAIDLDGTLLSPDGRVSPRTRDAVHQALNAGLQICFATGRNLPESEKILQAVGHYDSAVFVGGAMVIDTKNRITLLRQLMDPALARELCQYLESRRYAVLALQDRSQASADYLISEGVAINEATRHWMAVTSSTVQRAADLGTRLHEHTMRVGIVAEVTEIADLLPGLREHFSSRIVCHNLVAPMFAVEVLEIFDPAVNKWAGIMHIAARHGINADEIVAIGDDMNDIPMVSQAGLGVAMGNARPELKAVARRVIGKNSEEGLAEFLEELAGKSELGFGTN